MSYLLDTNACIAIINGQPLAVRERLRDGWRQYHDISVSCG